MHDKAISLHDVDLSLGRGAARVHILKGLSLDIARGEAVGLVGPVRIGQIDASHDDGRTGAPR